MKSGAIFRHVMLWTAVLIAVPAEGTSPEYWKRNVYQCTVKAGKPPIQDTTQTHIWFHEKGVIAFATTLDWTGVKGLYAGFSKSTCHHLGKVKDVLPKKETMVTAQGWFTQYHPLTGIKLYFQKLAQSNDKLVKFVDSIGKKTVEGRNIFAVHITLMKAPPKKRPKIYIQCLIHAREWISGSVCMGLADLLVRKQKTKTIKTLLERVEFVIVPVVNPDGYVKSWSGPEHRFWRRNLNKYPGQSKCKNKEWGVDLNRNFPFKWKADEDAKCYDSYPGPKAKSEPEVNAIIEYIKNLAPVYGALDFHSYGQDVLYPYLYTWDTRPSALPPDDKQLSYVAEQTAAAMFKVNKMKYKAQNGDKYGTLAAGTFLDWAYSEEVANFNTDGMKKYRITPLTIELRPDSKRASVGFNLDPSEIVDTCNEAINGILIFAALVSNAPIVYTK